MRIGLAEPDQSCRDPLFLVPGCRPLKGSMQRRHDPAVIRLTFEWKQCGLGDRIPDQVVQQGAESIAGLSGGDGEK